jgi:predicted transcriptional regulator
MNISEDMKRVISQRSKRDALYSNVYKNLTIVSCDINKKAARMVINLPIIDQYVNHEGFVSDAGMCHIIDTFPGIFTMAIGRRSEVAVNLKINIIGKARVGDVISIQMDYEMFEKGEYGNLEFELKNKENLIAKGSITSKFVNIFWAEEKI